MTRVNITEWDVESAQWLHEFLGGRSKIRNLATGHPLREGLVALTDRDERWPLPTRQAMAAAAMYGRALRRLETHWRAHADTVRAKLLDRKQAAHTLFELEVAEQVLFPLFGIVQWRAYDEGTPDLFCPEIDTDIECKLAEHKSKIDAVMDLVRAVDKQHPGHQRRLVAAVSFAGILDAKDFEALGSRLNRPDYFGAHPNITAVLAIGRTPSPSRRELLGSALGFRYEPRTMFEVNNGAAGHPIPPSTFGNGPTVAKTPITLPAPKEV